MLILDGCGCGELPDAGDYGDQGSDTLANTAKAVGGLDLPNLQNLGLGNIEDIKGVKPGVGLSSFGRMVERSIGKDSITGHWELFGVVCGMPFPTYPRGFPPEVIEPFERAIGRRVLGNKPASGTMIIEELGREHMKTGRPIVYTSADSVFQVAAHREVIPLDDLYGICEVARKILRGRHAVGRVIARPFTGEPGSFQRTAERKDLSLPPPEPTLLDRAKESGREVLGIGKIDYLFAGRGLSECVHTQDNAHGIREICGALRNSASDLIVANLIDFDMVYGHRNDFRGYARALRELDDAVPHMLDLLGEDDILYITSDHGNDPTTPSTDHSREYVPLLVYGESLVKNRDLGIRETYADLGQTIADLMDLRLSTGTSFRRETSDVCWSGRPAR